MEPDAVAAPPSTARSARSRLWRLPRGAPAATVAVAAALALLPAPRAEAQAVDPALLAGMEARAIGPAGMSGRVADIEVVASDPDVIYVGAATGGVWKSESRGLTWTPIFDEQPVQAIGAVSVFQPSPDVVWVGTGEGNTRNSVSVGNGVYKSLDGGRTWEHVGLEDTERIHRILLHPTDPEVAYVAALGRLWGENPERGVFRTTDGGRTWEKVLYVNERTGVADLVMDPTNPRKLLAATWEFRRWPWFFRSGGLGSGVHVTRDGGDTWRRLTPEDGLPEGELGRIGLAIARSQPETVYALVEAEDNVLLRSDDGGRSFRTVNRETNVAPRPFYYADLRVDPERPNRVYNLHSLITLSEDGGDTFRTLVPFNQAHPDHHAMWIHPEDPEFIVIGNDGGVYLSDDRGESWDFAANLPLAQYYHIRADDDEPYHVYGGMQDNGSWRGSARVWENGGIRNHHWEEVGFGDGFDTSPDPEDSMRGYAMSQRGFLIRWNLRTGERKSVRPAPPDAETELRFNWNAGFAQDPFDPATIYYGSQFVHRSTDRGDSWETISPDLTSNNPEWQRQAESGGLTLDVTGAENFTTIIAIEPSPLERGVLWVGTDDGRLHVTRDGGESWTRVDGGVPGVPADTWIPHIHASAHDAGTAFVVFDNHRRSDWTPYVYRTRDYGSTWTRLAGQGRASDARRPTPQGEVWGYALSIVQDPVDPELLFLGTEFGLHVSLDGGGSWMRWTHGVPAVGVRDLAIQAREADLVVGTHGRAAFVIDDIRPLRGLAAETLERPLHLFDIPDAVQYEVKQTGASRFPGDEEFRGENRPYGALITFSADLPDLPHPDEEVERERQERRRAEAAAEPEEGEEGEEGDERRSPRLKVEVRDASGETVRSFERRAHRGVNRIAWNLRRDAPERPRTGPREEEEEEPSFFGPSGAEVLPGTYTVALTLGEHEASASVNVRPDPRQDITAADRRAKDAAIREAEALQEAAARAITRLYETRRDVDRALELAREAAADAETAGEEGEAAEEAPRGPYAELQEAGRALKDGLDELEDRMWVKPDTKGIVRSEDKAYSQAQLARRTVASDRGAPTPAQLGYLEVARVVVGEALDAVNRFLEEEVAAFRRQAEAVGLPLMPERERVEVQGP